MNKAIENLIEPETVFRFAILIKIADLTAMQDLAFASQGRNGTEVRMHSRVHQTSVIVVALHISRAIKPIDS